MQRWDQEPSHRLGREIPPGRAAGGLGDNRSHPGAGSHAACPRGELRRLHFLAGPSPRRHLESDYADDRKCQRLRIFLSVHLERLALKFTAPRMQQCLATGRLSIKFLPKEMSQGRESEKD